MGLLELSHLAKSLGRLGVRRLYLTEEAFNRMKQAPARDAAPEGVAQQPYVKQYPAPDPRRLAEKQGKLSKLAEPLAACTRCKLCEGRTNLVYGVGNADSPLLFIGEGPGRDEDLQGEPFVGRAGQLLTDMITKGMKIRREDVYIANVVKCRPPENRTPEPEEMEACLPNLEAQIDVIQPKVIVTLGATPARALLNDKTGITKLRGNWREYRGIPLMPTLHPAYILRNPPAKKDLWEDMKQVIAFLNGE